MTRVFMLVKQQDCDDSNIFTLYERTASAEGRDRTGSGMRLAGVRPVEPVENGWSWCFSWLEDFVKIKLMQF